MRLIKDLLILALIAAAGWYAYRYFEAPVRRMLGLEPPARVARLLPAQFTCDKRIFCSQMTSCEETRFFIQHCPNTKLDRDAGGIDCEKQWCG